MFAIKLSHPGCDVLETRENEKAYWKISKFFKFLKVLADVAEPLVQCVPRQSLGTRSSG